MTNLNYLISRGKVDKEYRMTSTILGSGSYAVVKLAERIDNADEKVAIKIYEKNKLYTNKHRRVNLCNEIIVLRSLEHKNIVKLINVYEDRANVYLILEYIKGMSLFKYIKDKKTHGLGDQETRLVFKEILNTLLY
jgi:serine/threonine protein kinase